MGPICTSSIKFGLCPATFSQTANSERVNYYDSGQNGILLMDKINRGEGMIEINAPEEAN